MTLIKEKACKICGCVERMGPSVETCLACRVKQYKAKQISQRHKYYTKHKEKICAYQKQRRAAKLKDPKRVNIEKRGPATPLKSRKRWTVKFIKTEGGYTWRAWFRNPVTERLVKFESDVTFNTIEGAKSDYVVATR